MTTEQTVAGPYDAGDAPTAGTYRRVPTQDERLADARQAGHALPAGGTVPRSMYDEAVDAIALTERERDSLARRLGVRWGELEEARAARRQAEDERDDYARRLKATDAAWAELARERDQLRDALRPADWERQAVDAVCTALADAWSFLRTDPVNATRLADVAVRAIIDAGLAGPGGRCPTCQATYPRTMPPGTDARCSTCSTWSQAAAEEQPAEPDPFDHVLEVADGDRWGLNHPAGCTTPAVCPVYRLAYSDQAALVALPAGRYEVGVGDLRDRLLIGDRVEG